MNQTDRITDFFLAKGLYCRRKISKEGNHVGYRIYKGRKHQFWDWFPTTGTLTRFRDLEWQNMGKFMGADQVSHAIS